VGAVVLASSLVVTSPAAGEAPAVDATAAPAEVNRFPGDIYSARAAVRMACRRFYGSGCDRTIGWRSDCYYQRPARFVAKRGGCAYLGGYLPVWYKPHYVPFRPTPSQTFVVGRSTWIIRPESD
jgi:hypothetical protein